MGELRLAELPTLDLVGRTQEWTLPSARDSALVLYGKLLGVVSSRRPTHDRSHADQPYASRGEQCGACRWFEPRILREIARCACVGACETPASCVAGPRRYLIHFAGMSIVPGETNRLRHEWAVSPHEVIEILTTRHDKDVFLTIPAARVLAQAANFDAELKEAYLDRQVS